MVLVIMMILCIIFKSSLLSHFATILPQRNKHMEMVVRALLQFQRTIPGNSKISEGNIFVCEKMALKLNVPKQSLFFSQCWQKHFLTHPRSRNLFVLQFRYSSMFSTFNISCSYCAVLYPKRHAEKVVYFRCLTYNGGLQFGFKDGG